jgi:hypothetical protein
MVKPIVVDNTDPTTDPTPAKAAKLASEKGRKARKTTAGGATPSGKPQPSNNNNNNNNNQQSFSLIRPVGSKRRRHSSPQASPYRTNPISDINTTAGDPEQSLTVGQTHNIIFLSPPLSPLHDAHHIRSHDLP